MNKRYIILCVLFAFCSFMKADDVIPKNVERRFNLEVFKMLGVYESYATVSSANNALRFKELFESEKMEIYNDLMGLSEKSKLSVADYIQLLSQENDVHATKVTIKEVRKERVMDGDSVWLMDVSFDKTIRYICQGVLLDAEDYYGEPYHIKLRFSYHKDDEFLRECKIVSLEGSLSKNAKPFPLDYVAIKKEEENKNREKDVSNQGKSLQFNGFGQAIMSYSDMEKLSYYDGDVKMSYKQDSRSSHLYRLSFHPRRFRIKPHVDISMGGYYELKGTKVPYLGMKSKDVTFGFDVGYTFPSKSIVRTGIYTGLALSNSEVNYAIDSLNYMYNAGPNLDVDGDSYTRYYEVRNMKQDISLKTLVIPVYLDFDFMVSKYFSAYLNVGAKAYINLSNTVSSHLDVYKYGVYPTYGNLRMDETWMNHFGKEQLGNESQQRNFVMETNSLDAFVGGGLRVLLYRQLYFDLGFNYQMTVLNTPISMPNEKVSLQPYGRATKFPLIEYLPEGKERIHSITSNFEGLKRKAFKLNVGLMIKF